MSRVQDLNLPVAKLAVLEGGVATDCVYFAADSANGQLVTIVRVEDGVTTTRVYEFDTAAAPGSIAATSDVRVDVSAAVTPAASVTALVAAINGDGFRVCDALDIGGTVCALVALSHKAVLTATETLAGVGNILGAATFWGQHTEAPLSLIAGTFSASANARTIWAAAGEVPIFTVASTAQPTTIALSRTSAAGILESPVIATAIWRQVHTNFWALCIADGSTIFDADDVIAFLATAAMES